MYRMKDPTLYQFVNGKLVSKQLCTSNPHANSIIMARIRQYDPFQKHNRNVLPIQMVQS